MVARETSGRTGPWLAGVLGEPMGLLRVQQMLVREIPLQNAGLEPKPGVSSSATPAAGPAALGFGSEHPEPMPCLPSPPKIHYFALILQPWLGCSWLSLGLFQAAPSHPHLKAGEKSEVFSMACKYRALQEGFAKVACMQHLARSSTGPHC